MIQADIERLKASYGVHSLPAMDILRLEWAEWQNELIRRSVQFTAYSDRHDRPPEFWFDLYDLMGWPHSDLLGQCSTEYRFFLTTANQ